jgi:hypothetical protein
VKTFNPRQAKSLFFLVLLTSLSIYQGLRQIRTRFTSPEELWIMNHRIPFESLVQLVTSNSNPLIYTFEPAFFAMFPFYFLEVLISPVKLSPFTYMKIYVVLFFIANNLIIYSFINKFVKNLIVVMSCTFMISSSIWFNSAWYTSSKYVALIYYIVIFNIIFMKSRDIYKYIYLFITVLSLYSINTNLTFSVMMPFLIFIISFLHLKFNQTVFESKVVLYKYIIVLFIFTLPAYLLYFNFIKKSFQSEKIQFPNNAGEVSFYPTKISRVLELRGAWWEDSGFTYLGKDYAYLPNIDLLNNSIFSLTRYSIVIIVIVFFLYYAATQGKIHLLSENLSLTGLKLNLVLTVLFFLLLIWNYLVPMYKELLFYFPFASIFREPFAKFMPFFALHLYTLFGIILELLLKKLAKFSAFFINAVIFFMALQMITISQNPTRNNPLAVTEKSYNQIVQFSNELSMNYPSSKICILPNTGESLKSINFQRVLIANSKSVVLGSILPIKGTGSNYPNQFDECKKTVTTHPKILLCLYDKKFNYSQEFFQYCLGNTNLSNGSKVYIKLETINL